MQGPSQTAMFAAVVTALPAVCDAGALNGEWCHADWGAVLFWEESSLGIGEHQICDWGEPPNGRTEFSTSVTCRHVYFDEGSVIEIDHKTHDFKARQLSSDRLQVQFNQDAPVTLARCDE